VTFDTWPIEMSFVFLVMRLSIFSQSGTPSSSMGTGTGLPCTRHGSQLA